MVVSEDDLIAEIQRLAEDGEPPSVAEFDRDSDHYASTVHRKFGSWNNGIREAGFRPYRDITEDDLTAEIRELAEDGTPPTIEEFNNGQYTAGTVRNRFGSWNEGIREAGFKPNLEFGVTKDELLTEIQLLADDDAPPTKEEFNDSANHSATTVFRKFESWEDALRKAGFEPRVTKDELVAEIQRLAEDGEPPRKEEFNSDTDHSTATVHHRFGSWTNGVRRAGFFPHGNTSDEELLRQLSEDICGPIPIGQRDFDGRYSTSRYIVRLGDWWQACVRASLHPRMRRPLSQSNWEKFFHAANSCSDPENQLVGLLAQFTGMNTRIMKEISLDWITDRDADVLVTVPGEMTVLGEDWKFRIPPILTDAEGNKHETGLGGLLVWYLEQYGSIKTETNIENTVYEIAKEAELKNRVSVQRFKIGTVPLVRPMDLRITGGIQMARNGAPASRIQRHLGVEYTGYKATVDDAFLWCHIHDKDFSHIDSEVDGIYLDPDTGHVKEVESDAD